MKPNAGKRSGGNMERIEKLRPQLEAFAKLAAELGETEDVLALAWLLHQPAVTAPIIGCRTLEQFNRSLRAVEVKLDASVMARIDEIFPGPGGDAPRAYAW